MLTLVVTAVYGWVYLAADSSLPRAESYVFASVANAAKNVLRSRWRRRRGEIPLEPEPDLDEQRTQYPDPLSIDQEDRLAAALDLRVAIAGQRLGCSTVVAGPESRGSRITEKASRTLRTRRSDLIRRIRGHD